MSNKNFSVLLMLIAPAVWCPYQPSIYILLITSETMLWKYLEYKNEDSRMRSTSSLQHPLFCQAQHHGHSFHQVLCSPSLDHPARLLWITKKTWVQSTTIYMIPNHLHYTGTPAYNLPGLYVFCSHPFWMTILLFEISVPGLMYSRREKYDAHK